MARDTPKMGLHSWNTPLDPYSYAQLDDNWQMISFHDHTPGRGVQIPQGGIAPGAVGTLQLADGAVTNAKLAANSVSTADIQAKAVTLAQMAGGANASRSVVLSPGEHYQASNGDLICPSTGSIVTMPPAVTDTIVGFIGSNNVAPPGFEILPNGGEQFYGLGFEGVAVAVQGGPFSILYFQAIGGNWIATNGNYDSGWIPLADCALLTGVTAGIGGYQPAVRLLADEIHFRGFLTNGTGTNVLVTTPIFTLPSVFAPVNNVFVLTGFGPNGQTMQLASLLVIPNGHCYLFCTASGEEWPSGDDMYLDGVSFFRL
jgi:hypothetical protein